jgi:RimJ/RimL family protein N-acetyltransferase
MASLDWTDDGDVPELGYCFGVDHWGKGFATETARALIDYAFEEFAIACIHSGARVLNPASRHVLEKCGFQWTGVELHRFMALGSSTPVDCFKLERGVWSSLKTWSNVTRRGA